MKYKLPNSHVQKFMENLLKLTELVLVACLATNVSFKLKTKKGVGIDLIIVLHKSKVRNKSSIVGKREHQNFIWHE